MANHRFHKSSFRPHLIMGAERKPMLLLCLVCTIMGPVSMNLTSACIAAVLWAVVHPLLVLMATSDPQAVDVYLRSRRYPGYIRPFTTPFRKQTGYRIPSEDSSWKLWRR